MKKRFLVYKKYYDLIAEDPGHKTGYYARKLYGDRYRSRHQDFTDVIANMEYYGYLLYEDDNRNLYPYKIVDRYPNDIHREKLMT